MGKKVRCSECEYRNEWAVPWGVDKNNIDYAERYLRIAKHTFVCEHSMKTKQRDQEQYCKYFSRETKENKALKDVQAKRNVESLEKMIEEFKKGGKEQGNDGERSD